MRGLRKETEKEGWKEREEPKRPMGDELAWSYYLAGELSLARFEALNR